MFVMVSVVDMVDALDVCYWQIKYSDGYTEHNHEHTIFYWLIVLTMLIILPILCGRAYVWAGYVIWSIFVYDHSLRELANDLCSWTMSFSIDVSKKLILSSCIYLPSVQMGCGHCAFKIPCNEEFCARAGCDVIIFGLDTYNVCSVHVHNLSVGEMLKCWR